MSNGTKPWEGAEVTEKAQRSVERLKETFGVDVPAGAVELAASENGMSDIYMNLKRQLEEGKLSRADKLIVATAVASACGSPSATRYFGAAAREAGVSAQQVIDAVAVAGVCTIFNSYYHFRGLADGQFDSFKAPFNANTFMKTSLSLAQTELICVTVSALNGCHMCVNGHIKKAQAAELSIEQIEEAVRASSAAQAFAKLTASLAPVDAAVAM